MPINDRLNSWVHLQTCEAFESWWGNSPFSESLTGAIQVGCCPSMDSMAGGKKDTAAAFTQNKDQKVGSTWGQEKEDTKKGYASSESKKSSGPYALLAQTL